MSTPRYFTVRWSARQAAIAEANGCPIRYRVRLRATPSNASGPTTPRRELTAPPSSHA